MSQIQPMISNAISIGNNSEFDDKLLSCESMLTYTDESLDLKNFEKSQGKISIMDCDPRNSRFKLKMELNASPKFSKQFKNDFMKPVVTSNNESPELLASDVVNTVRQRTKLNLWTGTTLDVPNKRGSSNVAHKLDSHGFRVPDEDEYKFQYLTEHEAAMVLYKSILEIRDNLVFINKPSGIASQSGPKCKYNINDLLPHIEFMIRKYQTCIDTQTIEQYQLVHRLDLHCTGVMMIARNYDCALRLQEAFGRRWLFKEYLCITAGIPIISRGLIQLPLITREFDGIRKISIPTLTRSIQHTVNAQSEKEDFELFSHDLTNMRERALQTKNPVTFYEMLDRRNDAALLKCSLFSGHKHQVRAHLSYGLQTPILGDHKYAHAKCSAPQRLSNRLLNALHIRQSKVRYMSLNLHAFSIQFHLTKSKTDQRSQTFLKHFQSKDTVPNCGSLRVVAPPPKHFQNNLKYIGLKLPSAIFKKII